MSKRIITSTSTILVSKLAAAVISLLVLDEAKKVKRWLTKGKYEPISYTKHVPYHGKDGKCRAWGPKGESIFFDVYKSKAGNYSA